MSENLKVEIVEKELITTKIVDKDPIITDIVDKESILTEIVEKEFISPEITDKEFINVDLKLIDILSSNRRDWVIETPSNVDSLPSKKFRTNYQFISNKLLVFLNGLKIHSSEIVIHSSTEFSFPIDILSDDKIECAYIRQ